MPDWLATSLITLLKAILVILGLLTGFAYMTLVERKLLGRFQLRPGPNRVGPLGLLQPVADAIKSIFKEDINVTMADKVVYTIAPIISVTFALLAFGGIPAGPAGSLFGENPWVYNLDAGLLVLLAMTSMGVYGIFLGGWASGSKYPMLGGLRSSAQMISYELGMGLSLLGVLMLVGSTRLQDIVGWQAGNGWLLLFQMLGFVLFLVSAFAETNRAPFDLPEAEQELVAGFLTEYSAIKWALYQMAEYISMFTASAMMVTLFFGGWKGPQFLNGLIPGISEWPIVWFIAKMAFFVFFFIWVKASILRIRYDQLMRFGWKLVLPLALINTVLTAFYIAYFKASWGLWPLVLGSLIGVGLLIYFSDAVRSLWNTPGIRRAEDLSPRAHTVTPANRQTLGGD
ncbi:MULTISPECIES: NADH-quinone oxidoreductase subunit NuoH [Deinococcus]|jgi:NADH-quinone oxidoreductase subunit H|uniref:NADH-quinone oxidoreductase subunit H n=1 Tax=Deinococcus enclensis TaxID=1049582 RepID=A0ABT9MEE9_9DEIO|nr:MULTISPECIES: NADH-quinone oxidoreductase subunit NuoH [Deinococcus]MDP9764982.1 NADH-quinone oxidoreductase subunit H [Deinococcus enclensis]GHF86071.1 NADH-quinone oxidoreductase subunit H [Deinococcus ficus]